MDESKDATSTPPGGSGGTPLAGEVVATPVAHARRAEQAPPAFPGGAAGNGAPHSGITVRPEPRTIAGIVIWLLVLVVCYAGVVVTAALAEAHRRLSHEEKGLFAMACSPTMGEGVSCDQVLQSRWAYQWVPTSLAVARQWLLDQEAAMRGSAPPARGTAGWTRMPVAWLGLAYFAAVGTWFLFVGRPSYSRRFLHLLPLVVIGVALIGSARFMYLLLFRLPAICPLCMATHALNLLLFIGAVLLGPKRPREGPGVVYAPRPSWKQAVTTLVLVWFVVQVVLVNQAALQSGSEVAAYQARLNEYESNRRVQWELAKERLVHEKKYEIPVDADDPILGPANARRTLVLFSDFQCPGCKVLHDQVLALWPELERIAAPYGGIRLVYKHYPLYTRCNPRAGTNLHAYSCDAAKAAEAARIVGGAEAFWKMGELLYQNQQDLDLAPYAKLARQLGLDVEAFERARLSKEAAERVARHVKEGAAAEMSSTPGLYLAGVRVTEIGRSGPSIWRYVLSLPEWPPTEAVLSMPPGASARPRPAMPTSTTAPAGASRGNRG